MVRRILYKLLLASIPALLLVGIYVAADPFAVLRHYPDLYHPSRPHLEQNEDYVATETFLHTYNTAGYDSYIFGNSRSRFFAGQGWGNYVHAKAVFPYSVALESLFGIAGKVKLLDKKGVDIKNVLLVLDPDLLAVDENSRGHLYMKHPAVSGGSMWDFQFASFKDFFNPEAMSLYLKALRQGNTAPAEDLQLKADEDIAKNRDAWYAPRLASFYKRSPVQQYAKPLLGKNQKKLLNEIKQVFARHNTDYQVVLSPLYDQKKLDPIDRDVLDTIFGASHIYDFSGINDITSDVYNYYEVIHFRAPIAKRILDSVYRKPL